MKKVLALILIAIFTACSVKLVPPSQTDADRAVKQFPGTTVADLTEGKTIFETHCNKCHSLKRPFRKTDEEVKKIMPSMAKKAKLDSRSEELVLKYILTMKPVQQKSS